MVRKKILYFMPDNPIQGKAGNVTRLRQMLQYLNESGLEVHFASIEDWGGWSQADRAAFYKDYPNISLHLFKKKHKGNFLKYLFLYKVPYLLKQNKIDISSFILRKQFKKFITKMKFDKIIISYASWGSLLPKHPLPYTIIDTHDFMTAQVARHKNNFGSYFEDEIEIIKKFDEIWTYSIEEKYIFEQFTDRLVQYLPISFPQVPLKFLEKYKYDILYVASDNDHNLNGFSWFMKTVFPLLPKHIHLHVIGKISTHVKEQHSNLHTHGMVESLAEYYTNAKITICPMLSGTGVKIKVLESLAQNIPVVTNPRGVDGLANKTDNGCIVCLTPAGFANAIIKLFSDDAFFRNKKIEASKYIISSHSQESETVFFNNLFK